jgi:hypothetical protein
LVDAGGRAAGNGDDHGQFVAPSLLKLSDRAPRRAEEEGADTLYRL